MKCEFRHGFKDRNFVLSVGKGSMTLAHWNAVNCELDFQAFASNSETHHTNASDPTDATSVLEEASESQDVTRTSSDEKFRKFFLHKSDRRRRLTHGCLRKEEVWMKLFKIASVLFGKMQIKERKGSPENQINIYSFDVDPIHRCLQIANFNKAESCSTSR